MIAAAAIVLHITIITLILMIKLFYSSPNLLEDLLEELLFIVEPHFEILFFNGLSVVVSWALFALAGNLGREAGWIDGLGTVLGVGWVCLMLLCLYFEP